MKKRVLLFLLTASAVSILQSCQKTEVVKKDGSTSTVTSSSGGLHIDNVGDYSNFQVINRYNGLSAQVSNFSLDNGGTGSLAAWANTGHQKWRITNVSNGAYTIMNLGSGKFIQAYNYNGTNVPIQNSADNNNDQLWIISLAPNGYKITSKSTGLSLTANGTGTILLKSFVAGNTAQVWGASPVASDGYRDDDVVGFFHRTNRALHSVAFDQGNSIPLADGRVLWITEDAWDGGSLTANGDLKCNYFFSYRNSVMIQPASRSWDPNQTGNITVANSTQGRPYQVFDIQKGTDWTWPAMGIEIGDKVYVGAGEGVGLGATGNAFYELTENATSAWNVKRYLVAGANNNAAGIGYGNGFYKNPDGYTYTFGGKGAGFNGNQNYVARFPSADFFSWTFWNGTAWTTTPVAGGAAIVSTSQQNTAFAYWHGKYIMMQMDLGFFCDPSQHNIYVSTSSSPTGPFTKPIKVFTIEDMDGGHIMRYYTPAVHPEFDNGKNELLLTYSVNFSGCTVPDECVNGGYPSRLYQVKGVRVPAAAIGLQ